MSLAPRAWLICLLAGLIPAVQADDVKALPKASAAAKPVSVPDADDALLEFLGSVDSDTEDEDWLEYLSQADLVKIAKARKSTPAVGEVKKDD